MTRLEHQQVPQAAFDGLKPHFSDKEIADITYAVCHMNALNRLAIAFHQMPAE